jgi:hypothetical protein
MLEHPRIRRYSFLSHPPRRVRDVSSDKPSGADNQQETRSVALDPWWIVGFTDGEGCFSVSVHRNDLARPTGGWHLQPTFQVSQHEDHRVILLALRDFFDCGTVRSKGEKSAVEVYVVHSTIKLVERVIPFFERYELRVKRDDFEKFADIVRSIRSRGHHRPEEFDRLVRLAYSMNARGRQRKRPMGEILLGSSETVREAPLRDQR